MKKNKGPVKHRFHRTFVVWGREVLFPIGLANEASRDASEVNRDANAANRGENGLSRGENGLSRGANEGSRSASEKAQRLALCRHGPIVCASGRTPLCRR